MPRLKAYSFSGKSPDNDLHTNTYSRYRKYGSYPKSFIPCRFGHPAGISPVTVRDRISDKQDTRAACMGVRVICPEKNYYKESNTLHGIFLLECKIATNIRLIPASTKLGIFSHFPKHITLILFPFITD